MTEGRAVLIAHPGAGLYGSDRVMLETVDALRERGWQVTVTLPVPRPLVEELERRGARVRFWGTPVLRKSLLTPLGVLRLLGQMLRSLPGSVRVICESRAELVHLSTLTVPLWLPVSRALGRPVACHVHESERSVHPVIRKALAAPLLLAKGLIVNSEYAGGVLIESFPCLRARSEAIYNAVPGPAEVVRAPTVPHEPLRMLVGRLSPRRGPQVALELVRPLAERGVCTSLELLRSAFSGNQWFEEDLRSAAAELGPGWVVFAGFVPDIWSHLADSDVVLVPSQGDEPFGNIAVEAVLAARPAVVSARSGLDEAVAGDRSARSVPTGDLATWADAVAEVANHWPRYRKMVWEDAVVAAERHSPALYPERVERRLSELAA